MCSAYFPVQGWITIRRRRITTFRSASPTERATQSCRWRSRCLPSTRRHRPSARVRRRYRCQKIQLSVLYLTRSRRPTQTPLLTPSSATSSRPVSVTLSRSSRRHQSFVHSTSRCTMCSMLLVIVLLKRSMHHLYPTASKDNWPYCNRVLCFSTVCFE